MRTILQNRWFSETFREQALSKAVSCALKVRRATAKVNDNPFYSQTLIFHDLCFSIKMDF